jgi:hypothetical protein
VSALFLNAYTYLIQNFNYVTLKINICLYFNVLNDKFGDHEMPRSTGDDLENVLFGYKFYHEDELQ